jgi:hypothetical protein
LKAATERGVTVRAISIIDTANVKITSLTERNLIDYRSIRKVDLEKMANQEKENALTQFRLMSKIGGNFIIDDKRVLNVLKNQEDKKITGILIEVPAIPALQRISLERFIDVYSKAI